MPLGLRFRAALAPLCISAFCLLATSPTAGAAASQIRTCKGKAAAPTWAFVPRPSPKALSRLSLCVRGEGDTFIVEMKNRQPYGVVLDYGAPVKFGWSERGFGLPTLTRALAVSGQPDGLYIAPNSRASIGLTPGLTGPASFTAKPTLMSQWLDRLVAYSDIGGDALVEVFVRNSGCANLIRGALTADLATTLADIGKSAAESLPALGQCIAEMEAHLARQATKGRWYQKVKKLAKVAAKYDKLYKMSKLTYANTRQILALSSPGYVTVVPRDRPGPFTVPGPAQAPAPPSAPAPTPAPAPAPAPAGRGDRMSGDARLVAANNDYLQSADGRFRLVMQADGNLVLYAPSGPIWATSTVGRGANHLRMQGDGNLVMYNASDRPIWASNTPRRYNAYLIVQNDGNVVIYNDGAPIWSTGTAGRT